MIHVSRDETNKKITILGVFGPNLRSGLRQILSKRQIDTIFITASPTKMSFYEFFSLEVYETLKQLRHRRSYGVFARPISEVIRYIEEQTWVSGLIDCKPNPILDRSYLKTRMNFEPLPKQVSVFDHFERAKTCLGLRGILIHGEAGTGKELHKETPILTQKGWIPIKDITIGTIVYGQDGHETTVVGVYPQGKKPLYKITFDDGRTILAGTEHLWKVTIGTNTTVVNTKYLLDNYHHHAIYIDLPDPIYHRVDQIDHADLPTVVDLVLRGNTDCLDALDRIEFSTIERRNDFITMLVRRYGIDFSLPIEFVSTNGRIADRIGRILRSLGIYTIVDRIDSDRWRITVQEKTVSRIIHVEYALDEDAYCIAVDNTDRLYIAKDYIVTHNTYMSLSIAEMMHSQKVLVVCPLNIIDHVWLRSISDPNLSLYRQPIPAWSSKEPDDRILKTTSHYLVHYEYLPKVDKLYPYLKNQHLTVILDESHNLNELSARRTRLFLSLLEDLSPNSVLLLSGTPIKALGREMIPIVKALDPLFTGPVVNRFKQFTSGSSRIANELLSKRLGILKAVVTKDDVAIDKPVTQTIDVRFPSMENYTIEKVRTRLKDFIEQRIQSIEENKDEYESYYKTILDQYETKLQPDTDAYRRFQQYKEDIEIIRNAYERDRLYQVKTEIQRANQFEREVIEPALDGQARIQFREAKTIYKYPMLKVQGDALGFLTRLRIECFSQIAAAIDYRSIIESTIKKTIVFTNYIEVARQVAETVSNAGYRPMSIYGTYTKELPSRVKQFINNDNYNPLVTTYKSLSTGTPLTVANTILIIDPPFRSYVLEQTIARIARLGQDTQTYVYFINLPTKAPNIVDRNFDILSWSIRQVKDLTGQDVSFDLDEMVLMGWYSDINPTMVPHRKLPIADW